ncbi:hypothetical protein D3C76_1725900 [compost metagenome]
MIAKIQVHGKRVVIRHLSKAGISTNLRFVEGVEPWILVGIIIVPPPIPAAIIKVKMGVIRADFHNIIGPTRS